MPNAIQEMRLFSPKGERLYVNKSERNAFMAEVRKNTSRNAMIFCTLLHYTGARPTELRELTVDRVHPDIGEIVIRSIKKRKTDKKGNIKLPHYRTIPIPESAMNLLVVALDIRARQNRRENSLLWPSPRNPKLPIDAKTAYNWGSSDN